LATGISFTPIADLSDGSHSIRVSICDIAGNSISSSWSIIVDTEDPVISQLLPVDGSMVNSVTPTIFAAYRDAGSGIDASSVVLKVDSVDVSAQATITSWSVAYTPTIALSDGPHTIELTVEDLSDNDAAASSNFTINSTLIDTTAPTVDSISPANGETTPQCKPTISITYHDDLSGINTAQVSLSIDQSDVTSAATVTVGGVTYTPTANLAIGKHNAVLTIQDASGNQAQKKWFFVVMERPVEDSSELTVNGSWHFDEQIVIDQEQVTPKDPDNKDETKGLWPLDIGLGAY
jgi:hypothetical protein